LSSGLPIWKACGGSTRASLGPRSVRLIPFPFPPKEAGRTVGRHTPGRRYETGAVTKSLGSTQASSGHRRRLSFPPERFAPPSLRGHQPPLAGQQLSPAHGRGAGRFRHRPARRAFVSARVGGLFATLGEIAVSTTRFSPRSMTVASGESADLALLGLLRGVCNGAGFAACRSVDDGSVSGC
jgi:hypothetical protein